MSFLVDIGGEAGHMGGKARSLAELALRACETPPGFVVGDAVFRALVGAMSVPMRLDQAALAVLDDLRAHILRAPWPAGFGDELAARLAGIGFSSFSVRSSFAGEDVAAALAAGVYESRVDVSPEEVQTAIRQVLCSALSSGAVAYALAHGQPPAAPPVAVLVHAYVAGDAEGSAAFAPGKMAAPTIEIRRGKLDQDASSALGAKLADLAEGLGPTEIEWVHSNGHLVYLQARPYQPPVPMAEWSGWSELGEEVASRGRWRWDVAHNPLPLSPSQVGLVELADAGAVIGIRQRVLGGYLFYCRDSRPLPAAIDCEAAGAFFESLKSRVEERLAVLGPCPGLDDALMLFLSAYEPIFGVLQPALREAQRRLRAFLEMHAPAGIDLIPALRTGVPSVASERLSRMAALRSAATDTDRSRACSEYLARFGDEAALWDVSAKTLAEDPAALLAASRCEAVAASGTAWQQARNEVEAMLTPALRSPWREALDLARTACALGEADDWLYARAQAGVRRALLTVGERLQKSGDLADATDVFFLPLTVVRSLDAGVPPNLRGQAMAGRQAWEQSCGDPPPLHEQGPGQAIRGTGTGGRAIGRVAHHRPGQGCPAEAVLVATSLLPTELPLIQAVAIVTETGALLDHVAAQARERSIPCVVGASGASAAFSDGDLVLVDADRGVVVGLG